MKTEHIALIAAAAVLILLSTYMFRRYTEKTPSRENYLADYYKLKMCRCGDKYDRFQSQFSEH